MEASRRAQVPDSERFLLVRSGGLKVALPIHRVKRVLRSRRTFPVPGSKPQLLGLLQVAGEPVTVLDLGSLLDGERAGRDGSLLTILVAAGAAESAELIGLAVNEALCVTTIPSGDVTPVDNGLIRGESVLGDEVVRILDPARLGGSRG